VKTAQTEAFRELVDEIRKNAFLKDQLVSLIVFGSFIRGDFIEKQSDLDIYGVFNKMSKETISKLRVDRKTRKNQVPSARLRLFKS
jgi:predicted nucleotidyltransferase